MQNVLLAFPSKIAEIPAFVMALAAKQPLK